MFCKRMNEQKKYLDRIIKMLKTSQKLDKEKLGIPQYHSNNALFEAEEALKKLGKCE